MPSQSEALNKLTMVRKRATSLAFGFVALFIFLSLLTFSSRDLSQAYWPPAGTFHNVCGRVGALLANWLTVNFGYASYLAAALAIGFAIRCLMKRDLIDAWMGVFGALVMLVSAAVAAQLVGPQTAYMPGSGGVVGIAVSDVLILHVGRWGTWLVTVLLFSLGGLLLSADELAVWAAKSLSARAKGWMAAYRERAEAGRQFKPKIKVSRPPVFPAEPEPAATSAVATVPKETGTAAKEAEEVAPEEKLPPMPIDATAGAGKTKALDKIAVMPSSVVGKDYQFPPLSLLDPAEPFDERALEASIRENSTVLERTLSEFGIGARVVGIEKGPSVTRYEIALAPGIKVNRITSLSDDIAMAVKAKSVRVVAPIPGKSTAGVEVPNAIKEIVHLIELLTCDEFKAKKDKFILPVLLGKDASGTPILSDLTRMPHLLIAGATGSGKSVCLNSIIVTTLMLHRPENVRLILVDPKMVDLGMFEYIPHLLTPVVTDMKRAPYVLEWATKVMDERYDWLARAGVRHITQYNKLGEEGIAQRLGDDFDYDEEEVPFHMPYIVIVVDELADMMMVASKEVEVSITRLAQKSRAVGIHIVLATQRPSVDVITGLIKSNLPTRISFQVTSKVDSRTILDRNGAEKLLGCGDLLFVPPGTSDLVRVQGTYVSDHEIRNVVDFVNKQGRPAYLMNVKQLGRDDDAPADEYSPDDLYDDACRVVLESRRGSVSLLQRKLEIGYTRSARLVDMMAVEGIVGGYKGSKAREVIMTLEEWEEQRGIPPEQRTSAGLAQDEETRFSDDHADDE